VLQRALVAYTNINSFYQDAPHRISAHPHAPAYQLYGIFTTPAVLLAQPWSSVVWSRAGPRLRHNRLRLPETEAARITAHTHETRRDVHPLRPAGTSPKCTYRLIIESRALRRFGGGRVGVGRQHPMPPR
jgi:hypothetical protein